MLDVCVNTIVRNGDDYIVPALESVLPYVKRAIVTIDSRSTDQTLKLVADLASQYKHLEYNVFLSAESGNGLVAMRNHQLARVKEKYVWIVDSDEIYPKDITQSLGRYLVGDDIYAFRCWAPINSDFANRITSNPTIPRIYRMKPNIVWRRSFGQERIHGRRDKITLLPFRYLHFTHLKKDDWRSELKQQRRFVGRHLLEMPPDIKELIKNYVKK